MNRVYIISIEVILIVGLTLGCESANNKNFDKVLNEIAKIDGAFKFDSITNTYSFNQKDKFEEIFLGFENKDELVILLFNNLDNEGRTDSYFGDNQLLIGNLCFQALIQLIYYEPIDDNGDIIENWEGYIMPYSNIDTLSVIKEVWRDIIDNKSYIFQ